MIRINLLPFRAARKKENIRRQIAVFFLSVLLIFVALYGVHDVLADRVDILKDEVETKKADLEHYKSQVAEVERLQKHIAMVEGRLKIIDDLARLKGQQVQMMEDLTSRVVEKRMWLTQLENTVQSLTLRGYALDNTTVANFMSALEASGQYTSVDLQNVVHEDGGKGKYTLKKFVIVCNKPVVTVAGEGKKKRK
ncbi:MAG: PilN domain-containing protein [Deltaproteobacteria bacterium]|nr:PilN domain-containing protein [Deltaproteobacteria bacterium]